MKTKSLLISPNSESSISYFPDMILSYLSVELVIFSSLSSNLLNCISNFFIFF
jgi:hypothetical protein